MFAIDIILALLSIPVLLMTGYLALLTLLSRRSNPPPYPPAKHRFDIVVPAHNEELGIEKTVKSLLAVDYPANLRRVIVVADNCSDSTAQRAKAAGAEVLVRVDAEKRGKGFALAYAFERGLAEGFADAFVVVDADSIVSSNLLRAFASRLESGACAVQAEYGVQNRDASWRTRLMTIALALFHGVRSLGRERLKVSCGLRGNGMCFESGMLRKVPHDAFSLVEDIEYGIRLGEAGFRVHFAGEAHVLGEMVTSSKAADSQRRRWEGGRLALAKNHALRLFRCGIEAVDPVRLDLAMDLVVPPLTIVVALSLFGTLAAALFFWLGDATGRALSIWAWSPTLPLLTMYIARGWWLSGTGARGLLDLFTAPLFVIWKLMLLMKRPKHKDGEWVRTAREGETR